MNLGQYPPTALDAGGDVSYGTHTLPRFPQGARPVAFNTFWTSGKPSILKDEDYKRRRAIKHSRHLKNAERRASENANGSIRMKRA